MQETVTEEEAAEEGGQDIVPGGDPDAGMPAEQADIHGIHRGSPPQIEEPITRPHPPATDGLDNIEVENNNNNIVDEVTADPKSGTQPPDSD